MFQQKYSLKFQIGVGILCGLLNRLFAFLYLVNVPLYLDTIFTVSASFFGIPCGLISIVSFYVFSLANFPLTGEYQIATLFFSVCSIITVFIVWAFVKNDKKLDVGRIVLLILAITFAVAISGGIVYVFVFKQFAYIESTQVKYLTYALLRENLSIIVASILPRIPINLVDKTISVVLGYHFAIEVAKLQNKHQRKQNLE